MEKKIKTNKPEKPFNPLPSPDDIDDEEESGFKSLSQISVGDISIISKKGLKDCKQTLGELLKNKQIRSYLDIHNKKKFLGGLSYLG